MSTLYLQGGPNWCYRIGDAVYGIAEEIVRGVVERGGATYLGRPLEVVAEWSPTRGLAFFVSY